MIYIAGWFDLEPATAVAKRSHPIKKWGADDGMRIEIDVPATIKSSEECHVRAVLFNDSYEPVPVSRNAFVGPTVHGSMSGAFPTPEAVEATFGGADEPLTLQPFTFYGRERSFQQLAPGEMDVTARYQPAEGDEISASRRLRVEQG